MSIQDVLTIIFFAATVGCPMSIFIGGLFNSRPSVAMKVFGVSSLLIGTWVWSISGPII